MKNIYPYAALAFFICGCATPALYKPARDGDISKVRALLAAGADPNEHKASFANWTPLHLAAGNSRVDVARLLLEHGADPNADAYSGSFLPPRTYFGRPLHFAACTGNTEMVKLLLEAGADPDPSTEPGQCMSYVVSDSKGTPLWLAEKNGNTMAAELIKAAIASRLGLTVGGVKNADEYGPLVGGLLQGYQGGGKTIAVTGFSYADGRVSLDGEVVAARFTTELIKLKKLTVVERKEIQKMLGELKLQNAGAINPESAKKLGKMLGADLLVVGTMAELPGNILELNVRLAGVESGAAIGAVSGQVKKDWLIK